MKCTQQKCVKRNRFYKRFIPIPKNREMELNKLPETASKSGVTGRKEKMMFE